MYWFDSDLISLKAFLGANGIITSKLDTAHDVIDVANKLFEMDCDFGFDDNENHDIMLHQQTRLSEMRLKQRRELVRRNTGSLPDSIVSKKPRNVRRLRKRGKR